MDILKIVEEKMGQNTYIISDEKVAVIIDAGASLESIEEHLKMFQPKPKVKAVFLTHAHFDHIRNLDAILEKYDCQAYIFRSGKEHLFDAKKNLSVMEEPSVIKSKKRIETFEDGDHFEFGDININCYNTPGHSIDSSVFVINDNMFVGDTVFKVGLGRTDMFSGNENVQVISLRRLIDTLIEGINTFYPGHGENFDLEDLQYNIERHLGDN